MHERPKYPQVFVVDCTKIFAAEGNAVNDFGSWIRKNSARPWFAEFLQIQLRPAKWPIQIVHGVA